MSIFAIGDLHLHFQAQLKGHVQLKDPLWRGHEELFMRNCRSLIGPEDTLLLLGDHSWGRKMAECEKDFEYILSLPGRKVLLRGNHDMFWDANKTPALNRQFEDRLFFLQNNFYACGTTAFVGTKGYTFEGPFRISPKGRVLGWDEAKKEEAERLIERELGRLEISLRAACDAGYSRLIMLLHYPPTDILQKRSGFTDMAEKYGVSQVLYAHCHGASRFHDSLEGMYRGVEYHLCSGDFLRWMPMRVTQKD